MKKVSDETKVEDETEEKPTEEQKQKLQLFKRITVDSIFRKKKTGILLYYLYLLYSYVSFNYV